MSVTPAAPKSEVRPRRIGVVLGRFEPLVARGLTQVLCEDGGLCILDIDLERSALQEAVMRLQPRVAIVDEAAVVFLCSLQPSPGFVVLAREPTVPYGMALLAAGVSCLAWNVSVADVLAAVNLTADGGCMFVATAGERVERRDRTSRRILTDREVHVLQRLSEGKSHGEIALELGISVGTAKKHTTNLLRKLNAPSKRDLIGVPVPRIKQARDLEQARQ